jgi:hypothetical protein
MYTKWSEDLKEGHHLEGLGVGRIILKWILKKQGVGL